jgi:hypothetical protein
MTTFIGSIRGEYLRYKGLAEAAIDQVSDDDLYALGTNGDNSIAVICRHVSGNLRSRFTDFLSSDGEKPWRNREGEFQIQSVSRKNLLSDWDDGWRVLLETLESLSDDQLQLTVTIRGQPLSVHEALHRSLAHLSYHVGQVVYIAKLSRGKAWKSLSIPPGQSGAYNQAPTSERPADHHASLSKRAAGK